MKYAIAVDIGATNVRVALGNDKGKILFKLSEETDISNSNAIQNQVIRLIRQIINRGKKIEGICVGSIGPLDYKKLGIKNAPNLPFKFVSLKKLKNFKLPLHLYNDATLAVLGEKHYGLGKGCENLIYLTFSTGIGAGIIIDNALIQGSKGNAAEIDQFYVGELFNNWEGYASAKNVVNFYNKISKKKVKSAEELFMLIKMKNKEALMFVNWLAKINARGVNNLIAAYNPEMIIFGGPLSIYWGRFVVEPIKKYLKKDLDVPKFKISKLKDDVVLMGAFAIVFKESI